MVEPANSERDPTRRRAPLARVNAAHVILYLARDLDRRELGLMRYCGLPYVITSSNSLV